MPSKKKNGILHALLPGARVDKNTHKILVRIGTSSETVIFNVGGTVFETYKSTLRSVPNSRLGSDAFLAKHFRPEKNDHFFDRDPEIFHCVLNYHRTGELHLPTSVCGPVVKSELEYWGVDEVDIEECCWSRYSTWASNLKALRKLEEDRKAAVSIGEYPQCETSSATRDVCRSVWRFFSDPTSSKAAQIYAYVSITIIITSIFSFCAQTHDFFKVDKTRYVHNSSTVPSPRSHDFTALSAPPDLNAEVVTLSAVPYTLPSSNNVSGVAEDGQFRTETHRVTHPVLYYLDIACLIFFILELTFRFLVTPRKCRFLILPMTIVEILALMPDLVDLLARVFAPSASDYKSATDILSFMKVFRVFRIFRLMRHIPGLWILFYTLKASIRDLLLLLLFLGVGMLVFSSLVYFAEHGTQESFSSIPKCFWWAVITMTTVGYGDMSPETNWGYLVGTATGISGVLMIGFTVPVLVNNFIMYYNHTTSTIHREKHRRESLANFAAVHKVGGLNGAGAGLAAFGGLGFGERLLGAGAFSRSEVEKDSNANEKTRINDRAKNHVVDDGDDDDERGDGGVGGSGSGSDGEEVQFVKATVKDEDEEPYRETTFL